MGSPSTRWKTKEHIDAITDHTNLSPDEAAARLARLARRVWHKQALRLVTLALAAALPVAALGSVWGWPVGVQAGAGLAVLAALLAAGLVWLRRQGIDAALVARHLDRTNPALEESTALLLRPPEALALTERLQQRRVLRAFARLTGPLPAPARGLRQAGLLAGLSVLFSGVLAVWGPHLLAGQDGHKPAPLIVQPVAGSLPAPMPLQVERARVTLTPPAYTGRPAATSDDLNLTALQHTRASWTVRLNQPADAVALVFSSGDTLALQPDGAATYRGAMPLRASGFYYLDLAAGAQRARSRFYALTLTEDLPPVFTVMQPEPRTTIAPDAPMQVGLRVLADDDYGLTDARVVATVSKGSGEGVKFREQALGFDTATKTTAAAWTLEAKLDLLALGMEPGDELFFYIEGWDNRAPAPNRGRSETLFVVVQDTSRWAAAPSLSLALRPAEEYLRSQRQIILDTETLLAEQPDLSREVFQERSNGLGIDQKLLRLRYGQFLGEEFVSTVTEAEQHGPEGHAEEDHAAEAAVETSLEAAEAIIAQYGHAHDTEEGATFYSEAIKRELKAALAEMWEAELHLRTHRPEAALPYEYRALRLLKALQQKARIYVKRIGFEPPPLKPDEARLTGDLDAVQNHRDQQDRRAEAAFPAVREALALLSTLAPAPDDPRAAIAVLERAGAELAEAAVQHPGRYLDGLQALREVIEALEAQQPACQTCLAAVRQAFWTVLPPAAALPVPRPRGGTSLARQYYRELSR